MESYSSTNIRFGDYLDVVPNISRLRDYSTYRVNLGDMVMVAGSATPGDGNGGAYTWVPESLALDDGKNAVRPHDRAEAGRWKLSAGKGDTGADSTVPGPRGPDGPRGDAGGNITAVGLFTQMGGINVPAGADIVTTTGFKVAGTGVARYVRDATANPAVDSLSTFVTANGYRYRLCEPVVSVEMFGALTTDSDNAAAFAAAAGTGKPQRLDSKLYNLRQLANIADFGPTPCVMMTPGYRLDGQGATLRFPAGGRGICWLPQKDIIGGRPADKLFAVQADMAVGATAFPLEAGAGANFAIGDEILWRLGDYFYDKPETDNWGFGRVLTISGDTITIDRPIPRAFILAGTEINKFVSKVTTLNPSHIHDFYIDGVGGIENGIAVSYARNVTIERICGRNTGAGIIVGQYCDGVTIRDIDCDGVNLTQASYGAAIAFAETRALRIERLRCTGYLGAVKVEADAHAHVENLHFINTLPPGRGVAVLQAAGRSTINASNVHVEGRGGLLVSADTNGVAGYEGRINVHNLRLVLDSDPTGFPTPVKNLTGVLDMLLAGKQEVYEIDNAKYWERTFFLKDNEYLTVLGPSGLLADCNIFVSNGTIIATDGELIDVSLGRLGNNGQGQRARLIAGQDISVPVFQGTNGGVHWNMRSSQFQVLIVTSPDKGLASSGKFVRVKATLIPEKYAVMPYRDIDALRESDIFAVEGETVYDPPSLAAGASATTTVNVATAAVSDYVDAVIFTAGLGGLTVREATVTSPGVVTVTFVNNGTTAIDRASGTLRVRVCKTRTGL